ncbi:glycosyltransferase family 61 protein [Chryseobacterium sp. KCF3-3]|uniref:glycosyltransferase family 61 protein n=1 Tax=Chryseobacterium sp. KCF3-3 TaxID=3231511 RepID=UPI0038B2CA4C
MAAFIRKFVDYIKSNDSLSNYFKRTVYNFRYKSFSEIVSIKDIIDCKQQTIQKLAEENKTKTYLSKFLNIEERYIEVVSPEVSLYQFEDAYIDINSSSILQNDNLITHRSEGERFNEGFVNFHNDKHAKIIKKEVEELEEGFFLGGNGSWNWFHFLIEIMPKITLLNPKYTSTVLVNDIVLKVPSMKKILDLFIINKFDVKYLNPGKTYHVKKLYHINDFNHIQFNRFDNLIKAEGAFYNTEITYNFSNYILEKLVINDELPKKLFLYRKNTHRIAENQDQILEYLKKFDFVPICLEELSIEEQASYFKNAEFIIGISGAAWTNLIFCRNQPKAICFTADNAVDFNAFSNLAYIFNVDFYAHLYVNEGLHTNSNFTIIFDKFIELFNYINEK